MAFQIKYTRLFECRIWHGYYLHQGNRQNFYDLDNNNPVERTTFDNILSRYDVGQIFDIRPLKNTASIMVGHRMKAAYDTTGFFVGVAVKAGSNPGLFEPFLPIGDGLRLQFGLRLAKPAFFSQVTNERMRTNLPAIYYFSNLLPNDSFYADSLLATISQQYPNYQKRRYEMGELIHDGSGLFRSILADNSGAGLADSTVWEFENPTDPGNNFENRFEVNENDRVLLPSNFDYTFTPQNGITITDATIVLEDLQANVVQTDTFSLNAGQIQVPLDYSNLDQGWYILTTSTPSDNYATTQLVYLNNDLYDRSLWGVIDIGHDNNLSATNSIRRILESDGSLKNDGAVTETPVFHLRVPNRYTYWRYKMHPTQPLAPTPGSGLELVPSTTDLMITSSHLPNTQFGISITYPGPSGPAQLPSPVEFICRPEADGRIYSDVHLGILPL